MQEQLVQKIVEEVLQQVLKNQPSRPDDGKIPIGVSARHVHLAQAEVEQLFGENYQLTPKFELSQPGQFAAEETVVIAGPKGSIERVRILVLSTNVNTSRSELDRCDEARRQAAIKNLWGY
ncbi:Phosphate propanoyltransferase [Lysinibacillus sphaericus]